MCEYCEGKEDISNKIFEDGSKFSDTKCKVFIELDEFFKCYCNGEKYQFKEYAFPINYCPMCRKEIEYKIIRSNCSSRNGCRNASNWRSNNSRNR